MFTLFKTLHFIGISMFLGSIAVYIAMGTPFENQALTLYSRETVYFLVPSVTIFGIILTGVTGILMGLQRRKLIVTKFFKVKASLGSLILANSLVIYNLVGKSVVASRQNNIDHLESLLLQEGVIGAINLVVAIFLIAYSTGRFGRRKRSRS